MVKIVDTGPYPDFEAEEPYLPFGIRVLDAREYYNTLGTGQSLYISRHYMTKNLWLTRRTFNYEVDWDYLFKVTKEEAREIVSLGYAAWHWSLKDEEK